MATQITPPGPPVISSLMAQDTLRRIRPRMQTTDQFRWPSQAWIRSYVEHGRSAHQHAPSQTAASPSYDESQVKSMDTHAEGEQEEATQVEPLPPSEAPTGMSLPNQVLLVLLHLQSFLALCPLDTVARLARTCKMIQEPSVAAHLTSRTQTLHRLWILLQKRESRQQQKKRGIVACKRSIGGGTWRGTRQVQALDLSAASSSTGDISAIQSSNGHPANLDAADGNPLDHLERRIRPYRSATIEDLMNHGNHRKIIRQHRQYRASFADSQPFMLEQEEQPMGQQPYPHNWVDGEAVSRWQEIIVEVTDNLGLPDVTSRSEAESADEMETTVELHRMDQHRYQMVTRQQHPIAGPRTKPCAPDTAAPEEAEQTFRRQAAEAATSSQASRGDSSATTDSMINMCMHCEAEPGIDWPLGLFCRKCYSELSAWLSEN